MRKHTLQNMYIASGWFLSGALALALINTMNIEHKPIKAFEAIVIVGTGPVGLGVFGLMKIFIELEKICVLNCGENNE